LSVTHSATEAAYAACGATQVKLTLPIAYWLTDKNGCKTKMSYRTVFNVVDNAEQSLVSLSTTLVLVDMSKQHIT